MNTNKKDLIEALDGVIFIVSLALGLFILALLRSFGVINPGSAWITCFSLSGFCFIISDYLRFIYDNLKNVMLFYLYILFFALGVISLIFLPPLLIFCSKDWGIFNDSIVLYSLTITLLIVGLRHGIALIEIKRKNNTKT